ncbi:hypothetical protein GEMRC1_003663 [Eukaryota sp. GEM-RC1]
MPTFLLEVCPSLKRSAEALEMQLIRRFPGKIQIHFNINYNDDEVDPRPDVFCLVQEYNNETLLECFGKCPSFSDLEALLQPIVEPPKDPTKGMSK